MATTPSTPNVNVFINCPFDPAYQRLFDAIVFAIAICGFTPRSALEIDDSGQVRFTKIVDLIRACRFGIHDLSRTDLSATGGLPRFNMPLELGLFLGAVQYGDPSQGEKRALVIDSDRTRYRDFISDLAGHDIKAHANDANEAIGCVRAFLAASAPTSPPGPAKIRPWFARFEGEFPGICTRLHLEPHEVTFVERRRMVDAWIRHARGAGIIP